MNLKKGSSRNQISIKKKTNYEKVTAKKSERVDDRHALAVVFLGPESHIFMKEIFRIILDSASHILRLFR